MFKIVLFLGNAFAYPLSSTYDSRKSDPVSRMIDGPGAKISEEEKSKSISRSLARMRPLSSYLTHLYVVASSSTFWQRFRLFIAPRYATLLPSSMGK